MSCSPFDLKDYFFGELAAEDRAATEKHVSGCSTCRDELADLSGLRAALLSVSEEEPPRRIAFVSDKVFEPRWWQKLWTSGPQLGFAASALLAVAILVHGVLMRPVLTANPQTAGLVVAQNVSDATTDAEVQRRVQAEVARVMAENEGKQLSHVLEVVNTRLRHSGERHDQELILIREYVERLAKQNANRISRASYEQ